MFARLLRKLHISISSSKHQRSAPRNQTNSASPYSNLWAASYETKIHKSTPKAIRQDPLMYSNQASSSLFSKLPIELRDMIWGIVLGGNTIHMYWQSRDTLLAFVCESQGNCISMAHEQNFGRELRWDSACVIKEDEIVQYKGWMGLLLACRATHFEALKILYSTNSFDLSDHWTNSRYLPWSIPINSLSNITTIRATCHGVPLPSTRPDFKSWKRLWETLALCTALRSVQIQVIPLRANSTVIPNTRDKMTEAEDELLEPVQSMEMHVKVQGRRGKWILILPCDEKKDGRGIAKELKEADWEIIRT